MKEEYFVRTQYATNLSLDQGINPPLSRIISWDYDSDFAGSGRPLECRCWFFERL